MNLALFDFDGTITDHDMYSEFLRHTATPLRSIMATCLLTPFYLLYKMGWFPASKLRPMYSYVAFAHREQAILDSIGQDYADNIIPNYLRTNAMARIHWHKENGDNIVVVSASLDIYLKHWCEAHDIKLICSELAVHNGTITGYYASGDCSCETKSTKVRAVFDLQSYEKIFAYGDTNEDLAMLALADEKYMNWKKI